MIISVSGRTDIPEYYSEWFFNRLKVGHVLVRNPMNFHQISKINLSSDVIDGIVFWTKNPIPMLPQISRLEKYNYYFHFTVTSYGKDMEPNVPSKKDVIIPAFRRLSKTIGKEKVIWRYDPIFLNDKYTMDYHREYFRILASEIGCYTEKCTVGFLKMYRCTAKNTKSMSIHLCNEEQQRELIQQFSEIAAEHGFYINICSAEVDCSELNVKHSCCIDKTLLERIGNYTLINQRDKNQRKDCGCYSSIDIGTYDTCKNGCRYCYATNYGHNKVQKVTGAHDPNSELLFGTVGEGDIVREIEIRSLQKPQTAVRQPLF